ncbi:MAG: GH25 family lysozyme, partial [Anaerolineaceae bacterium]
TRMDFNAVQAHSEEVVFIAARAGVSWSYKDPMFDYYWSEMVRIGACRLAYHVIYPSQDVTKQVDHNMRILESVGFDAEHERTVLDLELDQGIGKQRMTDQVAAYLNQMKQHTGRYPILYSRAQWLNTYLYFEQLPAVDLWLAQYCANVTPPAYNQEAPQPPKLPKGASTWLIHQTGSQMPGPPLGAISHYLDYNRWNGNHEAVLAYFGISEAPEPGPVQPDPAPDQVLFYARITTAPPNKYKVYKTINGILWPRDTHWLDSGDVVPVYEQSSGWYRIAAGQWINGNYSEWVKKVDAPQPVPPAPVSTYYGPVFWQRDPRWKDVTLGTKSTIGANGCLMDCSVIAACAAGHLTNPYELNAWLTTHEGYVSGNLFVWDKLTERYPDMIFEGFTWWPSDATIVAEIKAGILPIILVDLDETTPQQDMHFVIGIGVDNSEAVLIYDPWTNDIVRFRDRYNQGPARFGSYRRIN